MMKRTQKFVILLLLLITACTAAQPSAQNPGPTATQPATTLAATIFRSESYSLTVSLPQGWAGAEGPVSLASPFDGLAAFNSFGQAGFFAKEAVSPDGRTFTYGGQAVLDQIPRDGAYIVLVHQSGGPALPPGDQGPEYERADLGGLWAEQDCRTGKEQAGFSVYDFFKGGRRLRLEVYCGEKASDDTAKAVDDLLASWRFDAATPVAAETPTPTPDTSAWNSYTHPTSGVSVRYPPGWKGGPTSSAYGADGLFVMQDLGTFSVFTL